MTVHRGKYGAGDIVYASLDLNAPKAVQTNILDKDSYNDGVYFEVITQTFIRLLLRLIM